VERPEVIVNVASSLDGAIASSEGALILSTTEDWVRVHELRNSVDAILVGVNTILKDDPLLSVRYIKPREPAPLRTILDTSCRIPLTAKVLQDQERLPSIIVTSKDCSASKQDEIRKLGAKVVSVEFEKNRRYLNLADVLKILKTQFGINKLLVEGGSTVITQFLTNRLVDTMHIFYAPVFVGGKNAKLLFEQEAIHNIGDAINCEIQTVNKLHEGYLVTLKLKKDE
jgi:riboflavin-specific deaminase-like protein